MNIFLVLQIETRQQLLPYQVPVKAVMNHDRNKESDMNTSGKKVYDRNFLLNLHNNSASMKKPEGLPNLEIVRDQVIRRPS